MKKTLTALLLTVLILFAGTNCFASDKARQTHGQVCADGNIAYPIVYGDTLSGIAWRNRTTVDVLQHLNDIVDPDMIYAGDTLCIPTNAGRRIAPVGRKKNAVGATTKQVTYNVTTNYDDVVTELATPAPTIDLTSATDVTAATQPFTFTPSATAAATPVAAALTPQSERMLIPPILEKAKRVKGYQISFTPAEAKERGIILNQNLLTEVILFNSEEDKKVWKEAGQIHNLRSRAQMKGKSIVLSISLKDIPRKHFSIIVVGLNQPIDGDYFTANCEPLLGRFPGPRAFSHVLFISGKIIANGLLMTGETFNPILGLTVGIGSPIAYMLLEGHADHMEKNALIEYQRLNAELDAEEFLVLHPEP